MIFSYISNDGDNASDEVLNYFYEKRMDKYGSCVDFRKNDFKKGITIKFYTRKFYTREGTRDDVLFVFVPYEDFIEKRVKVWLDGYCTNYCRDGYFSDPLCENFKYWNFNFQPEVEKFQLI